MDKYLSCEFTVPGIPVGKGRPRVTMHGTYTPKKTKEYEQRVRDCWKTQCGKSFAAGTPISAEIHGFFPIPKGLSKKKRTALDGAPHIKKCDADNLAKSILDALNGSAFEDDSAVCILTVTKTYSEEPYVLVCLRDAVGE